MASLINVTNVQVLDNPTKFTNPFQFEITFECLEPGIKEELEWKLIYVGSAEDEQYDQELDSVLVGPVSLGKNKFVFQAPPPDLTRIPEKDLLEVTVILLTCSYKEKEFIRIGYYVNNDYGGEPIPDTILTRYTRQQQVSEEQSTEADAEEEAEMAAADDEKEGQEGEEEEGDDEMEGEETDEKDNKTQPTQGSPSAATTTASLQNMSAPQFTFGSPSTSTSTSTSSSPSTTPSSAPDIDLNKLHRNILADKPRVTRFQIPWDQEEPTPTAVVAPSEISLQSESDLFSSGRAPTATSSTEKQHISLPNGVPYEENSIDMVDE